MEYREVGIWDGMEVGSCDGMEGGKESAHWMLLDIMESRGYIYVIGVVVSG